MALVPRDRKSLKIKLFHRLLLTHNGGNSFPAKSSLAFRKNGLIGEARNHTETILTGDVLSRKNRLNAKSRFSVGAQISEGETSSVIRAANDADEQGISWHFVRPKNFSAVGLALAIEPNQSLSHCAGMCGG